LQLGELELAHQSITDALATARAAGDRRLLYEYLPIQSAALEAEGSLDAARQSATEWLHLAEELKQPVHAAQASLCLATLDLDEANATEAETRARRVLAEFTKNEWPVLSARLVLTHALILQGKPDAAREVLARVEPGRTAHVFEDRVELAIARARLDGASGARTSAQRTLEGVVADTRRARATLLELKVRLLRAALGGSAATATLLHEEAARRGFELIARSTRPMGPGVCRSPF
jgi:hypothetical protein